MEIVHFIAEHEIDGFSQSNRMLLGSERFILNAHVELSNTKFTFLKYE